MHAGQLNVSPGTARQLVDEQFPPWRSLPIRPVHSQATVNAIFRVGGQLAARFALEPGDAALVRQRLESEVSAARELAGRTRFPSPEPVAVGEPGAGYPLPWLVQTWLPGDTATDQDPGDSVPFAHDLAEFIHRVRAIDARAGHFPARAGEVTCGPTTRGWRPVSGTADSSWTFRDFARHGTPCAGCRAARAVT